MASVTCRCQPVQERTSYSSSPTSPLAASKQASIVQRVPATRTRVGERRPLGRQGQVERQLVRLVELAPDQQPLLPAGRGAAAVGRVGPVVEPRSLGALAGAQPLPALGRDPGRPRVHAPGAQPLAAGHRQHVAEPAARLDPPPQGAVGPVHAVARHPRARHASVQRPLQHRRAELGLGDEGDPSRHAGPGAAARVARPALRQVERAVDQRPPVPARVAEEDADLAVLDAARRAGILPLHAADFSPFFTNPVSSSTSTAPGSPRCSTT